MSEKSWVVEVCEITPLKNDEKVRYNTVVAQLSDEYNQQYFVGVVSASNSPTAERAIHTARKLLRNGYAEKADELASIVNEAKSLNDYALANAAFAALLDYYFHLPLAMRLSEEKVEVEQPVRVLYETEETEDEYDSVYYDLITIEVMGGGAATIPVPLLNKETLCRLMKVAHIVPRAYHGGRSHREAKEGEIDALWERLSEANSNIYNCCWEHLDEESTRHLFALLRARHGNPSPEDAKMLFWVEYSNRYDGEHGINPSVADMADAMRKFGFVPFTEVTKAHEGETFSRAGDFSDSPPFTEWVEEGVLRVGGLTLSFTETLSWWGGKNSGFPYKEAEVV